MAEAKNNYANIEKINTLLGADGIGALLKNVQGTEKKVNEILRKISDLENEARRRVQEEAALEEAAAQTAEPVSDTAPAAAAPQAEEIPAQPPVQEDKKAETKKKDAKKAEDSVAKASETPEKEEHVSEKKSAPEAAKTEEPAVAPSVTEKKAEEEAPAQPAEAAGPVPARPAPEIVTQRKNGVEEKIIRTQYADRRERAAARATYINTSLNERKSDRSHVVL